jgi:tetratricopeptide (TPR) repeat protein
MLANWLTTFAPIVELNQIAAGEWLLVVVAAISAIGLILYIGLTRRYQVQIVLLKDATKNDRALLDDQKKEIKRLQESLAATEIRLPEVALRRRSFELEQGNHELANLLIEDWFRNDRTSIGEAAKQLSTHYASYAEPEIVCDAMTKSQRMMSVAIGCFDRSDEMIGLSDEMSRFVEELSSSSDQVEPGRPLDISRDFAGPRTLDERLLRIVIAESAARHELSKSRYKRAAILASRAVSLTERTLAKDHPLRLSVGRTLAECWIRTGNEVDAEKMLREMIAVQSKVLGDDDWETLSSQSLLCRLLGSLGRSAEAEPISRRIVSIQLRICDERDPRLLADRFFFAQTLYRLQRSAEAEPVLREIFPLTRHVHGEQSIVFLRTAYLLATVLQELGRSGDAEPILRSIVDIQVKDNLDEESHHLTVNNLAVRQLLAIVLHDLGRSDEAELILREIIPLQADIMGEEHPHHTLAARQLLAVVLHELGRSAEAEPILRENIPLIERVQGAEHVETLTGQRVLVHVLVALERLSEAELILREVMSIHARIGDQDASDLNEDRILLARLATNTLTPVEPELAAK